MVEKGRLTLFRPLSLGGQSVTVEEKQIGEGGGVKDAVNRNRNTLLPLAQLSARTGYHPVYLRRLLIDGKIRGTKVRFPNGSFPGYWVASEQAVWEYEGNKDRRGRKKGRERR